MDYLVQYELLIFRIKPSVAQGFGDQINERGSLAESRSPVVEPASDVELEDRMRMMY